MKFKALNIIFIFLFASVIGHASKIELGGGGGGGAGGDVVGPASSTDNAVARFDGTTGKLLKDGNTLIIDSGLDSTIQLPDDATGPAGIGAELIIHAADKPDDVTGRGGNLTLATGKDGAGVTPRSEVRVEAGAFNRVDRVATFLHTSDNIATWFIGATAAGLGFKRISGRLAAVSSATIGFLVDTSGTFFQKEASPDAGFDGTLDLGRSALQWRDLYLSSELFLGGDGSTPQITQEDDTVADAAKANSIFIEAQAKTAGTGDGGDLVLSAGQPVSGEVLSGGGNVIIKSGAKSIVGAPHSFVEIQAPITAGLTRIARFQFPSGGSPTMFFSADSVGIREITSGIELFATSIPILNVDNANVRVFKRIRPDLGLNGTLDLGLTASRFRDLYLSSDVILQDNITLDDTAADQTIKKTDETTADANAAPSLIVEGSNKTAGTGDGGSVTLGGGTSAGGSPGSIEMRTQVGHVVQSVTVTADDQAVTPVSNVIVFDSDDTTATDRTVLLQDGLIDGMLLTIIFNDATNAMEIEDSGNHCLSATFTPGDEDTLQVVWSATTSCWHQTGGATN